MADEHVLTHGKLRRLSDWWTLAVTLALFFALIVVNIAYTNYVDQRAIKRTQKVVDTNNQIFCDVAVASDNAYQQPQDPRIPETETRRQLADAVHRWRLNLHCDEK